MEKISKMKMEENKDYELVPNPNDSHAWQIRILTGDFTETVVQYGTIAFNEIKEHFTFNFDLIYSPDEYLSIDNVDLHNTLARILEDIIERGHEEGWVKVNERRNILDGAPSPDGFEE